MVIMKIRQAPSGKQIKFYNDLIIDKRIVLSMGGRLRLMNRYSGAVQVINQEEVTRLIENQEALEQSIDAYLQLGSK